MTEREKLIIEFYEEGEIPFIIKLIDYIKEKKDGHNNNRRLDSNRNDTIPNGSDSSIRTNELYQNINER